MKKGRNFFPVINNFNMMIPKDDDERNKKLHQNARLWEMLRPQKKKT